MKKKYAFLAGFLLLVCQPSFADSVRIETTAFGQLMFYPDYTAPATVVSLNDAHLSAQISAEIKAFKFRTGATVNEGDLLVSLDCSDLKQSLKQAEAGLTFNKDQHQRIKRLKAQKNASEEQYSRTLNDLQQAEASAELARIKVNRCSIRAPFPGIILERLASTGDYASPGTPLIRLLDTEAIELDAQVPNLLIEELTNAGEKSFIHANRQYAVKIERIAAYVDTQTAGQTVRLSFVDEVPLPGIAGRLKWRASTPHIPSRYIVRRNGQLGVFLYQNGKAQFQAIPDALEGHPAAIMLEQNTPVITANFSGLIDGMPVQLNE
jgi:RND family efflux transporter MFP subunit